MSKQQLESISAAFSAFKPSSRPEKPTPRKPILAPRPNWCTFKKPVPTLRPKKHTIDDYEPKIIKVLLMITVKSKKLKIW